MKSTGINRGKQFEKVIRHSFEKVPDVSIDRLHDQMTGYKITSANICDFIVYKYPYEYYIECKSVHGDLFPFSNITDTQWNGLLEKSKIKGVFAGVIVWWIDRDTTAYLPIEMLEYLRKKGTKSVHYYADWVDFEIDWNWQWITGEKKRVFFDYNMEEFLKDVSEGE